MPLHMKNALKVARFLEAHPKVAKVLHPGLPSHPQHEIALKQTSGHSGLIAFYVKEGDSSVFLQKLKVFSLAESLGGYESLAELP
jgi:cystathionine gamma-lyase